MSEVVSTASPFADSFQRCTHSFKELYLALSAYGLISLQKFNNEYARFGVWGGDSGADRVGRGSLDDVLRNDPKTASIIAEVLTNLDEDLNTCIALAKEYTDPHEAQSHDRQEWLSDEVSSISSGSDSDNCQIHSKSPNKTRRVLHFMGIIVDHIQSLFQTSILLRRPTISTKYLRSTSKRTTPETESPFRPWDLAHIIEKGRFWVNQQKWHLPVEKNKAKNIQHQMEDYLTKRLATANVKRREQLDFWQTHPAQPFTVKLPKEHTISKSAAVRDTIPIEQPVEKITPKSEMSKPTKGTTQNFSTVAKSDLNDSETLSGRPRTEYVSSTKGGKYVLRVPPVPKILDGSPTVKCPYCSTTLDAKSMSRREFWKKHVFRDLRPYVCTFQQCENPEKLYLTRHDWIYHETQMHRRQWICASCSPQKFLSRSDMKEHLLIKHAGQFLESQLMIIIEICERPMDDDEDADCPICLATLSLSALRAHLATHLEEMALFVLPCHVEDQSQDRGSDKAEGAAEQRHASNTTSSEDGLLPLDFEKSLPDASHSQDPKIFSSLLQSSMEFEHKYTENWVLTSDQAEPANEKDRADNPQLLFGNLTEPETEYLNPDAVQERTKTKNSQQSTPLIPQTPPPVQDRHQSVSTGSTQSMNIDEYGVIFKCQLSGEQNGRVMEIRTDAEGALTLDFDEELRLWPNTLQAFRELDLRRASIHPNYLTPGIYMCDLTLKRKLRGTSIITSGRLFFQSSTNLKKFQRALTGYKVLVEFQRGIKLRTLEKYQFESKNAITGRLQIWLKDFSRGNDSTQVSAGSSLRRASTSLSTMSGTTFASIATLKAQQAIPGSHLTTIDEGSGLQIEMPVPPLVIMFVESSSRDGKIQRGQILAFKFAEHSTLDRTKFTPNDKLPRCFVLRPIRCDLEIGLFKFPQNPKELSWLEVSFSNDEEREVFTKQLEDARKIYHRRMEQYNKGLKFMLGVQNYDYEVQLTDNEAPESEELQKVHNLGRIKDQALLRELDPLPKSDKRKRLVQPPSSDMEKISQPPATKDRPDTIRIKNIPATYSSEIVKMIVQGEFGSKPKIHSLSLHDKEHLCATVTFPDEEYGFPTEQLPKVFLARQSRSDASEIQYDADFLNFTTLYNANSKTVQADVDIVAVVGLGTHAFGTFRSTIPGSHEMWLRDFLPKDIQNTRVLLYGYPSTVSGGQSMEKIEDIASTFLNRLTLLRRKTSTRNRPIIFIGQSLGGLIVQESLLRAADSRDPHEREIFDSWHGLVGFGIPIAGLNNPSLIEAVKSQPNKVLIGQLCRDRENGTPSAYLIELKNRFENCCKQKERSSSHAPEVLYFWERHYSQPRTRNGIVGEKILMVEDSATPGARNLPLNSDHSGMVKYSGRSDLLYEDVSSNIVGMVCSLAERRNAVQTTSGNESS